MSSGTERSAKQAQKKEKPFDFSLVVDYTGKISNLLEDFRKNERFVECMDNQSWMTASRIRVFTSSQSVSSNMKGMGSDSASSK